MQCENTGLCVTRVRAAGAYPDSSPFCVDVNCVTTSIFRVENVDAVGVVTISYVLGAANGTPTTTPYTGQIANRVPCTVNRVKLVDACGLPGGGGGAPSTGDTCANSTKTTDCDRAALISKLDEIVVAANVQAPNYSAVLTAINTGISALGGNTDGIEALQAASTAAIVAQTALVTQTNTLLTTLGGNTDTIEALLNSLGLNTDQVEALLTSILAKLNSVPDCNGVQALAVFDTCVKTAIDAGTAQSSANTTSIVNAVNQVRSAVVAPLPLQQIKVLSGAKNYASGTLTAAYDPDGNGPQWDSTSAIGSLESFTIQVLKSGPMPSSSDVVFIRFSSLGDRLRLTEGQTFSWSIAQNTYLNQDFIEPDIVAEALGNCAYIVSYTRKL